MKNLAEDLNISVMEDSPAPRFGEVFLETGVRLNYVEQGAAEGAAVILLHGITDSSYSFSRVLPLIDTKYRVYALDQRGHGDSDRPENGYSMKDFAADVIAFMDAKNIEKAMLAGHSMGSFIALQTALDAPERIEKLILIGSATTARNEMGWGFLKEVKELKDPIAESYVREFQSSTAFHPLPEEFLNQVIQESLKVPARVWNAALSAILDEEYKPFLKEIKAPTLIVWGEKDGFFLREEQDALKAGIASSILKEYPESGHSPHWEKPEIFARDLNEFLRR